MAYQTDGGLAFASSQQINNFNSPEIDSQPAKPAANGFPRRIATAEQVLKAFNTRAFKREHPDSRESMLEVISRAMESRQPVPFVMYWGKGLRPMLAAPEHACLEFLASMLSRVETVYAPGATMTLVFTDTHANLNGHSRESIGTYFADLNAAARRHGFKVCLLSTLLNAPDIGPLPDASAEMPSQELLEGLRASAAKWFKGEGTFEEGALRYYRANMIERLAIEARFAHTIFVTFNGSALRPLFPETLPVFYMYSLGHGISDKPWFLPPDFTGRPRSPGSSPSAKVVESA